MSDTSTPPVSTSTQAAIASMEINAAIRKSAISIAKVISTLTPVQNQAAAIALANLTKVEAANGANNTPDLSATIHRITEKAQGGVVPWATYKDGIETVAKLIEAKQWKELVATGRSGAVIIHTMESRATPAATPEAPATPSPAGLAEPVRKRRAPAAESGSDSDGIDIPRLSVPDADPSAFDPITGSIAQKLELTIARRATQIANNAIQSLEPTLTEINRLAKAAASRSVSAQPVVGSVGSVDKAEVAKIIDEALNNGAGTQLRSIVNTLAPTALNDVLSKAADAIASAGPKQDASSITLSAAFDPIPDPTFVWTDTLRVACELLEKASASSPQNALVVGPTGAGKTTFAVEFAAKTGRKVLVMDCANLREARDWFGIKGAANGSTYFKKSQFWLAVERGNCVIVLDEFNRAADHVRNPLMPILDHRRQSFVEEVGETLRVGPGTVFVATMNEGLEYTGTHTTDRAMEARFTRRIEVPYLPEEQETKAILEKVPTIDKGLAEKLVEIANTIRAKAGSFGGGLTKSVSTRQLIDAASDIVVAGTPTLMFTLISHYSQEGGADSERNAVIKIIELKGIALK